MRNFGSIVIVACLVCTLPLQAEADKTAPTQNEEQAPQRIPVGDRALPRAEYIALQELRAKQAEEEVNENPESLALTAVGKEERKVKNGAYYYTSHPGAFHQIITRSLFSETVELEDGSIWGVHPGDRYQLNNWLAQDPVIIVANKEWFSVYAYRLVNQVTGGSLQVNMNLGPIMNGLYTRWISAIDYYNSTIYLNDGSVWSMSFFDSGVTNKWLVNDTIIIGINDGVFSSNRPNILINVNTLTNASGICLY